jgi:large conductance mechanosensitive channel
VGSLEADPLAAHPRDSCPGRTISASFSSNPVGWADMPLIKEFREFAVRGNVADMAVGVIMGAAFGKIVSSLVADVLMPPLGLLIGGVDFSSFHLVLREGHDKVPEVTLSYGKLIQSTFDFLLVALAVFALVKGLNRLKRKEEATPAAPHKQEVLLTEIRDLLKERR